MRTLAAVVLCLSAASAMADDSPDEVASKLKEYVDRCLKEQLAWVDMFQAIGTPAANQRALKIATEPAFTAGFPASQLSVGDIGDPSEATLSQISGKADALCKIKWRVVVYGKPPKVVDAEASVWLTGLSTEDLADGDRISLPVLEVIGTKMYPTAIGGTKTVYLVAPSSVRKLVRKELEQRAKAVNTALAEQEKQRAEAVAAAAAIQAAADKKAAEAKEQENKEENRKKRIAAAASLLKLGKDFRAKGDKDSARKRFQKVIDEYPETPSAKEAKQLLEGN